MIKRTLKQIHEMANSLTTIDKNENILVEGVTIDSRNVKPGNLFVTIVGEHVDG